MDLAPPATTLAMHSSESQAGIDAVARLATTMDWLGTQTAAMPTVSDAPAIDGKDAYLDSLTDYWRTPVPAGPGLPATTRAASLARRIALTLRDAAALREADGTLDERSLALIRDATTRMDAMPPSVRASELMIGDLPYAGALVLQRAGIDDHALLFLPGAGWQVFASLGALHEQTEISLREALVHATGVPGLPMSATLNTGPAPLVASRTIPGEVFESMVEQVAALQEQRVIALWDAFASDLIDAGELSGAVADALVLHDHLDIHAMLLRRDDLLATALDAQRLAQVPHAVRTEWTQARERYLEAQATAVHRRGEAGIVVPDAMPLFTLKRWRECLIARGITDDPADIVVTLKAVGAAWEAPGETLGLVAIAYRNVSENDTTRWHVTRQDGRPLSVPLSGSQLKAMVRELDTGAAYLRYLDDALSLAKPAGDAFRAIATAVQRARMQFELQDSRLSLWVAGEPRAFPHADRGTGYEWVKAVLDSPAPAGRRKVNGHRIVARQVIYRGLPLTDIFEIATGNGGSTSRVVLYTPDAPDGIAFREFGGRDEAARVFLHAPVFEGYLAAHMPDAFVTTDAGGERHASVSAATARAQWIFAQGGNGFDVRTEERFTHAEISGDLVDAVYKADLARLRMNARTAARTTAEADAEAEAPPPGSLAPALEVAAEIARGAASRAASIMPALHRFHDNIKAGDNVAAFVDFTAAYTAAIDVMGVHPARLMRLPARLARSTRGSATLVPTRVRIVQSEAVFERGFVARGIKAKDATAVNDGVYRVGNGHYIQQDGLMYRVRPDAGSYPDAAGRLPWRLVRDSQSAASGPIVERIADGTWQVARRYGLRGGGRIPQELPYYARQGTDHRVRYLYFEQYKSIWAHLERIAGDTSKARAVWAGAVGRQGSGGRTRPPLSNVQREQWEEALGRMAVAPAPPRPVVTRVSTRPSAATGGNAQGTMTATPRHLPIRLPAPAPMTRLAEAEWPDVMWVYRDATDILRRADAADIQLAQATLAAGRVHGVAGLTAPPTTFLASLPGASVATPGATLGSAAGGWVRIDLRRVRGRMASATGNPLPFELYRPAGSAGPGVIARPLPTAVDPLGARDLWLLQGEYDLGTWAPATQPRP